MEWQRNLEVLEMELKKAQDEQIMREDSSRKELFKTSAGDLTCAIMTRGALLLNEDPISQYEKYIARFIATCIKRRIRVFIIVLRNIYDVIAAEVALEYQKRKGNMQLICISLGEAYYQSFPPSLRSRFRAIMTDSDYVEEAFLHDDDTAAEEQGLVFSDTMLYIYRRKDSTEKWRAFLLNVVDELISEDCSYSLRKIWLVCLDDIRD